MRYEDAQPGNFGVVVMNENWVMLILGPLLAVFGLAMTSVSGPMSGAKPLYPPPLRFRRILVLFGVLISLLGAARLIRG